MASDGLSICGERESQVLRNVAVELGDIRQINSEQGETTCIDDFAR